MLVTSAPGPREKTSSSGSASQGARQSVCKNDPFCHPVSDPPGRAFYLKPGRPRPAWPQDSPCAAVTGQGDPWDSRRLTSTL